jgi:hypothetical protein
MARFFTLEQAEKLLPGVESDLREAIALKSEYQQAENEMQRASRHIMMSGGVLVDREQAIHQKQGRDSSLTRLKESIERIQDIGCVIKDLDIGLVDFPTQLRGEEVYLCWKLGESGIRFWHGVHEGFAGRKPVDQDFLDNHRGERAN